MKHLTILVPDGEGNNLSSIVGAYKIFARANAFRKQNGRKEIFSIQLAGVSKKVGFYKGLPVCRLWNTEVSTTGRQLFSLQKCQGPE